MPPALDHPGGCLAFFRYEATVTGFVADLPAVFCCLYDPQRFGANALIDSRRTRPVLVLDGMVRDNRYHIDPGAFPRGTTKRRRAVSSTGGGRRR